MGYWFALTSGKNAKSLFFLGGKGNMVADIGCSAGELEDGLHGIWLGSWVFMRRGSEWPCGRPEDALPMGS